jgi:hypothetical protein
LRRRDRSHFRREHIGIEPRGVSEAFCVSAIGGNFDAAVNRHSCSAGYPLVIGGVSYGFTFGGSVTDFVGTISNIRTPADVNGIYVAGGAGAAVGPGGGVIVLANQNGALLTLSGTQAGLIVAADLNGLVITIR